MDAAYSIIVPTFRERNSLQELIDEISAAEPGIQLIVTCQQGPPAFNRNYGLDAATTPVVVMVDDDIRRFPPFFARDLVRTLCSNPRYMVATAKLLNGAGRAYMGGTFPGTRCMSGVEASLAGWAPSSCMAIYRTAARFDESLPCNEDVDYCFQIAAAKPDAQFVVNNGIQVLHLNEEKWRAGDNHERGNAIFRTKWGREIP